MKLGELNANVHIDGARMRSRRKLAGLSVRALAEKVNCSHPYISILETQPDRTCSPRIFRAICEALELPDRSVLLRDQPEQVAA